MRTREEEKCLLYQFQVAIDFHEKERTRGEEKKVDESMNESSILHILSNLVVLTLTHQRMFDN